MRVRRLLSIALVALTCAGASQGLEGTAQAQGTQSNANTPKHALHKMDLWLAVAEPKPSFADIDAGMGVASAVEERLNMLNTEIGAVVSRRRTLLAQAASYRQKAAELRSAPRGETGIKRGGAEAKAAELEQKAAAFEAQAETMYETLLRLSEEERGLVDCVGRTRAVVDTIETSTIADAKQKQKAQVLAARTVKLFQIHAAITMTVMAAAQGSSS